MFNVLSSFQKRIRNIQRTMSSPMRLSDADSPGRTPRRQNQDTRSPSAFGTPRKYI